MPSLGIITMNALVASDSVIIPVQCEYYALDGVSLILNSIIMVQSSLNPQLRIEGVLLTMLDGRTNIGLSVIEEVRSYFKNKTFTGQQGRALCHAYRRKLRCRTGRLNTTAQKGRFRA